MLQQYEEAQKPKEAESQTTVPEGLAVAIQASPAVQEKGIHANIKPPTMCKGELYIILCLYLSMDHVISISL